MFLYIKYIMYCNQLDRGLRYRSYGWLKLMTCSYTCREQICECVKNVTTLKDQGFFWEKKSRFIFRRLALEESLKTFITKYMLAVTFIISKNDITLSYYIRNLNFITTAVDGSILKNILKTYNLREKC